jgi:hypothetical protein
VLDIRDRLKNLSNREKILIYGAVLGLVLFLIYQLLVDPLLGSRSEYIRESARLEENLHELKALSEKYIAEKAAYDRLKKMLDSKKGLSVLTYLENISQNVGITENIEYIKPKGSETSEGITTARVEIKIDALPAQSLLVFLYEIEEKRVGLIVTYLRMKPFFKEKGKVDVVIGISDVTVE